MSVVRKKSHWGLVDKMGKVLSQPQYKAILSFQEGRAVMKQDGKFGFLNLTGREVIPPLYSKVGAFSNGQAFATRWGLFIRLSADGQWMGVKLQSSTLRWLIALLSCVIVLSFYWWKRHQFSFRDRV